MYVFICCYLLPYYKGLHFFICSSILSGLSLQSSRTILKSMFSPT
ncbi:hypothetical protein LINPERPRIM_LOCUS13050 [Linum perenne]